MVGNWIKRVNTPEGRAQLRQLWEDSRQDIGLALGVGMLVLLAFMAGRVSVLYFEAQKQPLTINTKPITDGGLTAAPSYTQIGIGAQKAAVFVASKNGKKYHLPECPGAKQISEKNKIFFASREEAEATGYQPAANCPGL